jgi:hypothetical protein
MFQGRQHVTDDAIKTSIRTLLSDSISVAANTALPLHQLRGIAFFDPSRGELFTSLPSFAATMPLITTFPNFITRYGNCENRVLLQFLYQYFRLRDSLSLNEELFESVFYNFIAELEETHWVSRGVANLRHFAVETYSPLFDLGDGITIRGRNPDELRSLGFDDAIWERLAEDWHTPFGASSYVMVVEERFLKEPSNLISPASGSLHTKALRAVQALRWSDSYRPGVDYPRCTFQLWDRRRLPTRLCYSDHGS